MENEKREVSMSKRVVRKVMRYELWDILDW
jgi:hypothetical protein